MTSNASLWIIYGSFMVPIFAALGVSPVLKWRSRRRRMQARSPISDKLLRPAGESLRIAIEELRESLDERLTLALTLPGVVMGAVLLSAPEGGMSRSRAACAFLLCAGLLVLLLWRAFQTRSLLDKCRLGFHGERAVAEELNQLMRAGCHVFHDVPINPYGNIDHVIVSQAGVFAVETKTRRKRPAPQGLRDCDAVYDGKAVNFPTWSETKMLGQAGMQGGRLIAFLTSAVGEPVAVQAILTLPGWYVTSSVPPGKVLVLNPRQIKAIVADPRATQLSEPMIGRICHQLEQKCRSVDM